MLILLTGEKDGRKDNLGSSIKSYKCLKIFGIVKRYFLASEHIIFRVILWILLNIRNLPNMMGPVGKQSHVCSCPRTGHINEQSWVVCSTDMEFGLRFSIFHPFSLGQVAYPSQASFSLLVRWGWGHHLPERIIARMACACSEMWKHRPGMQSAHCEG